MLLTKRYYQYIKMLSSMEKNFIDQTIDFDIKQYKEIRKLAARQGEDYTTG